jgi:hypothetical protein
MKMLDVPKSGRRGNVVFFMNRNRQRERAYVVPKNVRNAATRRARGAFGALSKAYGALLTEEQRDAWNAAAARVLSRPRLGQCGPLTGQQHFVGINSARARVGSKMLLWPPAPVAFGPNPVQALRLRYLDGRLRVELKLCGPLSGDIMVFAQTPCSPGWNKWRRGTCIGLLPTPKEGISDITERYLEAFGEPEPGRKVFIRTRQQRNGWEAEPKDVSELVPVTPVSDRRRTGVPPVPFSLPTPRRTPVLVRPAHRLPTQLPPVRGPRHRTIWKPCTRDPRRASTGASPVQRRSGTGYLPSRRRKYAPLRKLRALPKGRRTGRRRELWHGS